MNILWMDDNIDWFHPWVAALRNLGASVVTTDTISEGLLIASNQTFDVILLDLYWNNEENAGYLGQETIDKIGSLSNGRLCLLSVYPREYSGDVFIIEKCMLPIPDDKDDMRNFLEQILDKDNQSKFFL